MNRRGFLTRSGLALGALIVGDEVLETLDRLTHRKVWALGGIPEPLPLRPKWSMVGHLYVRENSATPWCLHDTAPMTDASVVFRKPIPKHFTESQVSIVCLDSAPSVTVNAYGVLA